MFRFLKFLFFILVIALVGLAGYAYVGPYFGVDFSAPQSETRLPVTLDGQ